MKKKVLLFLLIAVFITAMSYAQSITVTNPHSGSTWHKGSTYTIRWTKSGSMDNNVKITLYKPDHTTLQMIIVRPTANDGSFSWTIPNSIPNGQYIVRVKTIDNQVYDDSDVFNIATSAPTGGTITVTDPRSGDCLEKGSSHTIRWTKSGSMNDSVKITLYKTDLTTLQTIIVNPTANDGSFSWTIPNTIPNGSYVVRVKTVDNAVYDNGDVFTISDNCSDNGIHIDPWIIEKLRNARIIIGWGPWGPFGPDGPQPGPYCPQCLRLEINKLKRFENPVFRERLAKGGAEIEIVLYRGEEPIKTIGKITKRGLVLKGETGRFIAKRRLGMRTNKRFVTINTGMKLGPGIGGFKVVYRNAETHEVLASTEINLKGKEMKRRR